MTLRGRIATAVANLLHAWRRAGEVIDADIERIRRERSRDV